MAVGAFGAVDTWSTIRAVANDPDPEPQYNFAARLARPLLYGSLAVMLIGACVILTSLLLASRHWLAAGVAMLGIFVSAAGTFLAVSSRTIILAFGNEPVPEIREAVEQAHQTLYWSLRAAALGATLFGTGLFLSWRRAERGPSSQ